MQRTLTHKLTAFYVVVKGGLRDRYYSGTPLIECSFKMPWLLVGALFVAATLVVGWHAH